MLFETLYRIDPRGMSFAELPATEYYQPRIDREVINGKEVYFVRETHGYFDDQQKKVANCTFTLNPDEVAEGYPTWEEAEGRYEQQLRKRAKERFVHVFAFDPLTPTGLSYRLLDPEAVSMLSSKS